MLWPFFCFEYFQYYVVLIADNFLQRKYTEKKLKKMYNEITCGRITDFFKTLNVSKTYDN